MKMRVARFSFAPVVSIAVFLLSLPVGAQQNPSAQAAEAARARRAAEARRRTERMQRHQFREVKEVAFPKLFGPVWYRPEKLASSVAGFLLSRESHSSGELVLEKDALTFKTDKETMRIGYDQIQCAWSLCLS